jgi:hypothetical protein
MLRRIAASSWIMKPENTWHPAACQTFHGCVKSCESFKSIAAFLPA